MGVKCLNMYYFQLRRSYEELSYENKKMFNLTFFLETRLICQCLTYQ